MTLADRYERRPEQPARGVATCRPAPARSAGADDSKSGRGDRGRLRAARDREGQVDRVVLNNNVELNATDEHSDELAEIVETVRFVEEE